MLYAHVYIHVYTCGSQRSMSAVFLEHSPPYFLRQNLFLSLNVQPTGWLD